MIIYEKRKIDFSGNFPGKFTEIFCFCTSSDHYESIAKNPKALAGLVAEILMPQNTDEGRRTKDEEQKRDH